MLVKLKGEKIKYRQDPDTVKPAVWQVTSDIPFGDYQGRLSKHTWDMYSYAKWNIFSA